MTANRSTHSLLGPLDPDPVARLVFDLAHADEQSELGERLSKTYAYVSKRLGDLENPIIAPEQARAFEASVRPKGLTGCESAPIVESLAVNLYARATLALRARTAPVSPADIAIGVEKAKKWFGDLERGALGEFLIDAEMAAANNPGIAQAVESATQAVKRLGDRHEELEPSLKAVLRQKDPDNDDCWCIVSGCNGYGDCRNFCIESWLTCVLIFIGIILIIILA